MEKPTVTFADGSKREVTNLGWLLRNRNNHGGIRKAFIDKLENDGAMLVVYFHNSVRYTCEFASHSVCTDWVDRFITKYVLE